MGVDSAETGLSPALDLKGQEKEQLGLERDIFEKSAASGNP